MKALSPENSSKHQRLLPWVQNVDRFSHCLPLLSVLRVIKQNLQVVDGNAGLCFLEVLCLMEAEKKC